MQATERMNWTDVRDRIHAMILDGTFGPGAMLPRDMDLAASFGCGRTTVQRAMTDLSDAGIVERRRKVGTRVAEAPVARAVLDIPVIRKEIEGRGARYRHKLLHQGLELPPPRIAAAMAAPDGAEMLHVQALHLADGRPHSWEDRWISVATVPEIVNVDLSDESANEWLVRNRPYDRCDHVIEAVAADPEVAAMLDVAAGTALLSLDRTTWIGDAAVTCVRLISAPGYRLISRG